MAVLGAFVVVFFALWAAVADLRTMEIPNRISVALLACYLVIAPLAGLDWTTIGWSLSAGLIWFVAGVGLMIAGVMGGGDVKVGSALVIWIGWTDQLHFLFAIGLCGGALALAFLVLRKLPQPAFANGRPWMLRLLARDEGIPYAVAIAAGTLLALPDTVWWI